MAYPQIAVNRIPSPYCSGMHLTWISTTSIHITAGQCSDSKNISDINIGNYLGHGNSAQTENSSTTLNAATNGVNGLDIGSLANNTWYAVYVIADLYGTHLPATLLSTSAVLPILPEGYQVFRRVGWVRTDGSAQIIRFWQSGSEWREYYQWNTPILVLDAGTATTYTAFSLIAGAPPQATPIWLNVVTNVEDPGDVFSIRPTGTNAGTGVAAPLNFSGGALSGVDFPYPTTRIWAGVVNGVPSLDYVIPSNGVSLSVYVAGFEDYL